MNVKYKTVLMGLMLLILQPTAIASPYFYDGIVERYSDCSLQLLDDNSVKVSFNVNMVSKLFGLESRHRVALAKLINIPNEEVKNVSLHSRKALLSLYFYNADGSPNLNININHLHNIVLNSARFDNSSDNIREIKFYNPWEFSNEHSSYNVSFTVKANTLKYIRIGATVGGELVTGGVDKPKYPLLSSKGVSFGPLGNQCLPFDPQQNAAPQALKVDPKFRLASTVWQLQSIDLDHLLDNTTDTSGLYVPLKNGTANRFCISYRAMGVQSTRYMISASNLNGLSNSNQHFQLKEKNGKSFINYGVRLKNNDNTQTSFTLPKHKKFIQLKTNEYTGEEQMCWSPKIRLYRTDTTDKGSYSDTLSFTITPEA